MWNPWKHLRIIGGVMCIVSAFIEQNRLFLIILGLMIQYLGVVGAIDRLERLVEEEDHALPTE